MIKNKNYRIKSLWDNKMIIDAKQNWHLKIAVLSWNPKLLFL